MRNPLPSSLTAATTIAALAAAGALTMPAARADESENKGTIQISYEVPKDPALQKTYDMAKKADALEMLRLIFISFRLPEDLYIKTVSCDGIPNAYFFREDDKPTIRICYEYLRAVYEMLPKAPTPEGITPREALLGQFLFTPPGGWPRSGPGQSGSCVQLPPGRWNSLNCTLRRDDGPPGLSIHTARRRPR